MILIIVFDKRTKPHFKSIVHITFLSFPENRKYEDGPKRSVTDFIYQKPKMVFNPTKKPLKNCYLSYRCKNFFFFFVSLQLSSQSASKEVYLYYAGITCRCRCNNAQISNVNYRWQLNIILQTQINIEQKSQSRSMHLG